MILAYVVLFVHWPKWAAIVSAISATGFTVWHYWEQIMSRADATMKFLRTFRAFREEGRTMKLQQREDLIQQTVRRIEAIEFDERQKRGQSTYRLVSVEPGRGEDPEIVAEAWRRFKSKRDEQDNQNWSSSRDRSRF